MTERIFARSRRKALKVLIMGIGMTALSAWLIARHPWVGWIGSIAGAGASLAILWMAVRPDSLALRLDEQGFATLRGGRPTQVTRWSDIEGFGFVRLHGSRMIGVVYRPGYQHQRAARGVVRALAGVEGAIGDHYEVSLDEVLNERVSWHKRYGAVEQGSRV
ncbi:hypothetical protein ACDA63_13875 [Uliginosibacterium sp. sgz301328]|uniref:hypothetical protein n=1 Tax=Uliginosibacterium sp. sgz301328 TaxID=3243764 RepID=UPI00359EC270